MQSEVTQHEQPANDGRPRVGKRRAGDRRPAGSGCPAGGRRRPASGRPAGRRPAASSRQPAGSQRPTGQWPAANQPTTNQPTGHGAVRFGVLRRTGALGRARNGDQPGVALHGACHDGIRNEPALSRAHARVCGRGRARRVVLCIGSGQGKRAPCGAGVHVGHGAGELLPRSDGSRNLARAAGGAFGRPAPAPAGLRGAADGWTR